MPKLLIGDYAESPLRTDRSRQSRSTPREGQSLHQKKQDETWHLRVLRGLVLGEWEQRGWPGRWDTMEPPHQRRRGDGTLDVACAGHHRLMLSIWRRGAERERKNDTVLDGGMAGWRHVGLVVKVSSGPLATTAGNNHEFDNALFRASKVQLEGHSTRSLAFAGESRAPHGGRGKDRRELPRT